MTSSDGSTAYVANSNDTGSVINVETNELVGSVTVDDGPETGVHYIGISPDGSQIYVTDARDGAVRVLSTVPAVVNHEPTVTVARVGNVDLATGAVTYRITVADPDAGDTAEFAITDQPDKGTLRLNADGMYTYTPSSAARAQAAAVNAPSTAKLDSFTVTATDGKLTNYNEDSVSIIDTATHTKIGGVFDASLHAPTDVVISPMAPTPTSAAPPSPSSPSPRGRPPPWSENGVPDYLIPRFPTG